VAQSAVPLGLCPAPLNLVLPPAFARAEAGSPRDPFFRDLGPTPHAKSMAEIEQFTYPVAPGLAFPSHAVVEANPGRLMLF